VATGDFNGDGYPDLVVANRNSNSVTVLTNDTHWGPAPRPAGHDHGEPFALVAALPDIGWPSAPSPLGLTTTLVVQGWVQGVLGGPPGSVGLPAWECATSRPLGRLGGTSAVAGKRDLLFARWDSAWLADG
jgi:hypothetical protein